MRSMKRGGSGKRTRRVAVSTCTAMNFASVSSCFISASPLNENPAAVSTTEMFHRRLFDLAMCRAGHRSGDQHANNARPPDAEQAPRFAHDRDAIVGELQTLLAGHEHRAAGFSVVAEKSRIIHVTGTDSSVGADLGLREPLGRRIDADDLRAGAGDPARDDAGAACEIDDAVALPDLRAAGSARATTARTARGRSTRRTPGLDHSDDPRIAIRALQTGWFEATLGVTGRPVTHQVTSSLERQKLIRSVAEAARAASRIVARATEDQRNQAFLAIADAIEAADAATCSRPTRAMSPPATDLAPAMRDRLMLDGERIGKLADRRARDRRAAGAARSRRSAPRFARTVSQVSRVRIPLGVIAMIYEARPNVTTDAAALCLKAGNACILRGGREALETNRALLRAVQAGLAAAELPPESVQLVPVTDREAIAELVKLDDLIDLCIPRGGEGLIRYVAEHARVPVIKHYKGVCHVYVHAAADLDQALSIVRNAKVQRPGVCNAVETVLVDRAIAPTFLPRLVAALREVELRGDAEACAIVREHDAATEDDWSAEYLDLILAVRVVDDLTAAVAHIERYGSSHTEAIVTTERADRRAVSRTRSTRRPCWSTPRRGSPTAASSASAPKSESRRRASTPTDRWAPKASPPPSSWSAEPDRSGRSGRRDRRATHD